jgi:hypothetical protein
MMDEVSLLRKIIEQRDQIDALNEQVDRQHSANSKLIQILYVICNNGELMSWHENTRDFSRGEWHVYSFYFNLLKSFVPDLVETHPEFGPVAVKLDEWSETIKQAAKEKE